MQVHIETEINAPADRVWGILAHQFADMADWTTTLSESRVVDVSELSGGIKIAHNAPVPARETRRFRGKNIPERQRIRRGLIYQARTSRWSIYFGKSPNFFFCQGY